MPAVLPADSGVAFDVCLTGELVLDGFFRTGPVIFHPSKPVYVPDSDRPWLPVHASPDLAVPGSTLEPEACIDPSSLDGFGATAESAGRPCRSVDVLSPVLRSGRDGRVRFDWTGVTPGKVALRGGTLRPGEWLSVHAVESSPGEESHFVGRGLPGPQEGSLALEYSDFIDRHVALRLTVRPVGAGSIRVQRDAAGNVMIGPGSGLD